MQPPIQPYMPPPPRRSETQTWVWLLGGCFGVFVLGAIGVCYMIYNFGTTAGEFIAKMDEDMRAESKALRVHDAKFVTYQGNRYLVGTVQNTSKTESFDGGSVMFNLFDRTGAERDTVSDTTAEEIRPGKAWRFKIAVTDPWASRFVLDHIEATKSVPMPAPSGR